MVLFAQHFGGAKSAICARVSRVRSAKFAFLALDTDFPSHTLCRAWSASESAHARACGGPRRALGGFATNALQDSAEFGHRGLILRLFGSSPFRGLVAAAFRGGIRRPSLAAAGRSAASLPPRSLRSPPRRRFCASCAFAPRPDPCARARAPGFRGGRPSVGGCRAAAADSRLRAPRVSPLGKRLALKTLIKRRLLIAAGASLSPFRLRASGSRKRFAQKLAAWQAARAREKGGAGGGCTKCTDP